MKRLLFRAGAGSQLQFWKLPHLVARTASAGAQMMEVENRMAEHLKTNDLIVEARRMIILHGNAASLQAAMKADEAMEKMDVSAHRRWLAVLDCIERLDFDREATAH